MMSRPSTGEPYAVEVVTTATPAEETPFVSVIVPTRDRLRELGATVRSALAQQGPAIEVVVVDDGSHGDVRALLDTVADRRVRLLRRDGSGGVAAARNAGIEAARGTWLAFLDDDDRWAPDKLARQLEAADAEAADVAICGVLAIGDDGRVFDELAPPAKATLARAILRINVIPAGSSNVLVRRALVTEVGGFDESYAHLDDWDLWIRLAQRARFAMIEERLVGYRYHGANRSFQASAVMRAEFERLAAKHEGLARAACVEADRVDFGRFLAWTSRRAGRRWLAAEAYWSLALRERDPGSAVRGTALLLGEPLIRAVRRRPPLVTAPPWATP